GDGRAAAHVRRPRHAFGDAAIHVGPVQSALGRASHDQGFIAARLIVPETRIKWRRSHQGLATPTRAATSTRFAAATILNPIADTGKHINRKQFGMGPTVRARQLRTSRQECAATLEARMKRAAIRVEPISTYLERRRKASIPRPARKLEQGI